MEMFVRDDAHPPPANHGPPSWVTSSAFLTSSASTFITSALNGDSNSLSTSSNLDQATSRTIAAGGTSPTTLTTSLSLGSSSIDLALNNAATNSATWTEGGKSTSAISIIAQTSLWSEAASMSRYQPSLSDSVPSSKWTGQPVWDSLTERIYPTPSTTSITSTTSVKTSDPTSYPDNQPSGRGNRHTFNGTVLASIVIPIGLVVLFSILLLVCLRRRRRHNGVPFRPMMEVREKIFRKGSSLDAPRVQVHQAPPSHPHLVMSPMNNTYFSGLDTMSMISAEPHVPRSSEDPPPPYWPRSEASARSVSVRSAVSSIRPPPPVPLNLMSPVFPPQTRSEHSPFDDPLPSDITRTHSYRSITSTLYSSNASLVEARPARRSVTGAYLVGDSERSPFADPEDNANI